MSLRSGMANLKGSKIRRQYLSKVLPQKLSTLTKDVPTPSGFLLGNNLNDRIGTIETSQKMLQTYSNSPYYKNSKNLQRFSKKAWKSKQGVQQQQPNQRLQLPPKTTAGVSAITIPQERLSCIR